MNKRIKVFILILLTMIISGCTANYDLKMSLDGSIEENVNLKEDKNKLLSDFSKKAYKQYVKEYIELNELEDKLDDYKLIIDKYAGIEVNNKYEDINEFINESPAIGFVFKRLKLREKDGIVILKSVATGYDLVYRDNDGVLNYTKSSITLSLPYEVVETNADFIDEENNTYTWNFDEDFDGIEIKYNPDKYYTSNVFKLLNYATAGVYFSIAVVAIIVLLILVIVILGIRLLIRERKAQVLT